MEGQKPQVDVVAVSEVNTPVTTPGAGSSDPVKGNGKKPKMNKQPTLRALEKQFAGKHAKPTDIEEVWFSGCHCGASHSPVIQTASY